MLYFFKLYLLNTINFHFTIAITKNHIGTINYQCISVDQVTIRITYPKVCRVVNLQLFFMSRLSFGNKFLQIFYGAFAFQIGALNLESNSLTLFASNLFFFSGNVNQYSGAHNNLGLGNGSLILK